jgi:ubiquinone/menaquinone biosynthesis C-methylase UbiE
MDPESRIAAHYTHGSLERAILDALVAAGKDPERLTPADLAPVDEFHIGGRQATVDFARELDASRGAHLLDIGAGLGGASRYFAEALGARVTGIDLTDEYVRVATALAARTGLGGQVSYRQGSALALPFGRHAFDGAYMLHVGMNISDKAALFAEVRRVVKPGGPFGIYDVMRVGEGALAFPVPWAESPETSFVETAVTYRRLLVTAGFEVVKERARREFAVEFFQQLRARLAGGAPPPLGLQLLMGRTARDKVANMMRLVETGVIAPTELISRAPAG